MDIVYLHGLSVDCVVGLWDWERAIQQRIIIDLDMASDVAKTAASGALEDTIDYKSVSKRVTDLVVEGEFELVESMAEKIAKSLQDEFDIPWCRVRINKRGAVSGAIDVGVIIERGSRD